MNIIRFLAHRLRTIRGMTIVHVGAHFGEEGARYQKWAAGKVVWIEAAPYIFEKLEQTVRGLEQKPRGLFARMFSMPRTQHVLIQALVGDQDDQVVSFHLFDNDGASNSVFKIHRAEDDPWEAVQETGEVLQLPMHTLDKTLEEAGVSPEEVDVLVLDVQGAELMCLKGADRVLKSARYLESEVSRDVVYEGGVLLAELEPWLGERGYVRRTMLRRPHMNAIFVNRSRSEG